MFAIRREGSRQTGPVCPSKTMDVTGQSIVFPLSMESSWGNLSRNSLATNDFAGEKGRADKYI
jgi:hypothetical protein